jgi:hypothetical protein
VRNAISQTKATAHALNVGSNFNGQPTIIEKMKISLPHTIENGMGEKLTFLRISLRNGIEYLEGENEVKPSVGPPMHVHYKQDECVTVLSGKMGYQLLGEEKNLLSPVKLYYLKRVQLTNFGMPEMTYCIARDI